MYERKCEEICGQLEERARAAEGVARTAKEDVNGVCVRQAETRSIIGPLRKHVELLDGRVDQLEPLINALAAALQRIEQLASAQAALFERVAALEKQHEPHAK